ncbi:MAG: hypothetical protein WBB28_01985 [Crinalium sp.]
MDNSNTTPNLVDLSAHLRVLGEVARQILEHPDLDLHRKRQTLANYETELVQVAASAIAALTDLHLTTRTGESKVKLASEIEREIMMERIRQDDKHGLMPRRLDPLVWVAILVEEVAEVAEEIYG